MFEPSAYTRFEDTQNDGGSDAFINAISNFSFAPQRFSSRDRPLSRFVLCAESVFGAEQFESAATACCQHVLTSASQRLGCARWRSRWSCLRESQGRSGRRRFCASCARKRGSSVASCRHETRASVSLRVLIAMLADLSEDCARFLRHWDLKWPDPIESAMLVEQFKRHVCMQQHFARNLACLLCTRHVKSEYEHQRMWCRDKTYAKHMASMLEQTRVLAHGHEYLARRNHSVSPICTK